MKINSWRTARRSLLTKFFADENFLLYSILMWDYDATMTSKLKHPCFGLCLSVAFSPARPNKLRTWNTFGVRRTLTHQCTCVDGPFCPHFAGAWAKGKRTSQNKLAVPGFFKNVRRGQFQISQLICQISQLIFYRRHVHASRGVPACIVAKWHRGSGQWTTKGIVLERNQARARSAGLESLVNLCKERLESVNKGKGMETENRTLFHRSTGPSSSPRVVVFIKLFHGGGDLPHSHKTVPTTLVSCCLNIAFQETRSNRKLFCVHVSLLVKHSSWEHVIDRPP